METNSTFIGYFNVSAHVDLKDSMQQLLPFNRLDLQSHLNDEDHSINNRSDYFLHGILNSRIVILLTLMDFFSVQQCLLLSNWHILTKLYNHIIFCRSLDTQANCLV